MKVCAEYTELISSYADCELSESEKKDVETHLNSCESCSALLALHREISNAVAESAVPAPDKLYSNVMTKILSDDTTGVDGNGNRRKVIRIVLTRYLPVAACLAIVIFALPYVINFKRLPGDSFRNESPGAEMSFFAESAISEDSAGAVNDAGMADESQYHSYALAEEKIEADFADDSVDSAIFDALGEAGVQSAPPHNATSGSGSTGGSYTTGTSTGREQEISVVDEILEMPAAQDQIAGDDSMPEAAPDLNNEEAPLASNSHATIRIIGDLPDFLLEFEQIPVDDATSHFIIPRDAAMALIRETRGSDEIVADLPDGDWDYAIVIYYADR